jgi:hypothetical protein
MNLKSFTFKMTQNIQITFIYFFAIIDLIYSVFSPILTTGYFPEILKPCYPFLKAILNSPLLKIWSSPEKIFFLSSIIFEIFIIRSTFNLSKLVKYNILLLFSLLMIQGLTISYWDLLFSPQNFKGISLLSNSNPSSDKILAVYFFLTHFFAFFCIYLFFYWSALNGKFATIKGFEWLTDSVAFAIRLKPVQKNFDDKKKN